MPLNREKPRLLRDNRFNRTKNEVTMELDSIYSVCEVSQCDTDPITGDVKMIKRDTSRNIHNPKLGTVQEFMKDMWQEQVESFSATRKKVPAVRLTLTDKRNLRRWFSALDADDSGEVSIEELEDPLISTGILSTKEQVIACMRAWDTDDSGTISFDEFVEALFSNAHTDRSRLQMLQDLANNETLEMETLIGMERRKTLDKLVVANMLQRRKEVDDIWKKERKLRPTQGRYCKEIQHDLKELEEEHNHASERSMERVKAAEDVYRQKCENLRARGLWYDPDRIKRAVSKDNGDNDNDHDVLELSDRSISSMTKRMEEENITRSKGSDGFLLRFGLQKQSHDFAAYASVKPKNGMPNTYKIPKKGPKGYRKTNLATWQISSVRR